MITAFDLLKLQSEVQQLIEMYEHFIIELEEMKERAVTDDYEGLEEFCEHQVKEMKSTLEELYQQCTQQKDMEL